LYSNTLSKTLCTYQTIVTTLWVGNALDVPWYASLPRLEARFYLEQYGGKNDVWIGKTLYRMSYVNNDVYLGFAKLEYNNCQAMYNKEWEEIQRLKNERYEKLLGVLLTTLNLIGFQMFKRYDQENSHYLSRM
ncbi:hypothetical protein RYX36_015992, partial [Vicia faba]